MPWYIWYRPSSVPRNVPSVSSYLLPLLTPLQIWSSVWAQAIQCIANQVSLLGEITLISSRILWARLSPLPSPLSRVLLLWPLVMSPCSRLLSTANSWPADTVHFFWNHWLRKAPIHPQNQTENLPQRFCWLPVVSLTLGLTWMAGLLATVAHSHSPSPKAQCDYFYTALVTSLSVLSL